MAVVSLTTAVAIPVPVFATILVFAHHLEEGIMIGEAFSLLVFLYKSMWPKVQSFSRFSDKAMHD